MALNLPKEFKKTVHVVLARADGPDFSLLDRKVFNVLYANAYRRMRANQDERQIHTIQLKDLAAAVLHRVDDIRAIKESLERLWSVKVTIDYSLEEGDQRQLRCHYLSYNMSKMNDGELSYAFDPILMQFIANEKVYALIELNVSSGMSSLYGSKLYEIMSMSVRMFREAWTTSVEDLRRFFEVGDKYDRFDHFKKNVIDRAIDDVNRSAPFRVDAECIREGRGGRVTAVAFRTSPKTADEFLLEGRVNKKKSDMYTIDIFEGVPEVDKLVPPDIRSDTITAAERLLGDGVDVLKLRDEWFTIYGAMTHTSPDEKFLAWVRIRKEKQDNGALQHVNIDNYLTKLVAGS